jgi:hypothetical protein
MVSTLHDAVVAFLVQDGWFPEHDDEAVVCAFQGDAGTWPVYALTQEADRIVAVYSVAPLEVPTTRQSAVMEFLTLVNASLAVGCFEQDLDEGQVRFRTSIDVEGAELSEALLRQLLHANVLAMDRHLPALQSVIAGTRSPRDSFDTLSSAT